MERFSFGPRDNGIIQIAYTVPDIHEAMDRYAKLLHVGPWFLVGPFVPPKGFYRGTPTSMQVSLAIAFNGESMIELIQQHDDKPSVFQETLKARGAHGFHHWGIGAYDFRGRSRTTGRWATRKHFRTPRRWGSASSISTPRATCPACSR